LPWHCERVLTVFRCWRVQVSSQFGFSIWQTVVISTSSSQHSSTHLINGRQTVVVRTATPALHPGLRRQAPPVARQRRRPRLRSRDRSARCWGRRDVIHARRTGQVHVVWSVDPTVLPVSHWTTEFSASQNTRRRCFHLLSNDNIVVVVVLVTQYLPTVHFQLPWLDPWSDPSGDRQPNPLGSFAGDASETDRQQT